MIFKRLYCYTHLYPLGRDLVSSQIIFSVDTSEQIQK